MKTLKPDMYDNSLKYQRKSPLVIKLFQGNALIPCQFLKDFDFDIITLIEVIEHIDLIQMADLEKNVFAFLNPKIVVVTTPNYDFNYFFLRENKQSLYISSNIV